MDSKRRAQGANSILMIGIVLAVIVVVNLLAQGHFARIDLTEDGIYTLSRSTKDMLRGLDDVVNVKVYFSKDLPTYLVTLNQQVKDMLDEYQAFGDENLLVEWEDPADDPETEQRCRVLGVPQVQLQIFEKDKAQVTNAYLGIAVLYEDRSEVIPVVQGIENLEYDLTSAIVKVFRKEEKTVGILVGPVEPDLDQDLSHAKELLGEQYRVLPVNISTGTPVPEEVKTLVIVQPEALSERERYEIDQFIMRGGALLLFHDPIVIPEGQIRATPRRSGMNELLARYGIDLGENLVLDARSHANAAFTQGFITFSLPYPYWVRVLEENTNPDNPVVSQLSGVVLPWTSTVAAAAKVPDSVDVDTLLSTGTMAFTRTGTYDLNPQQRFTDAPREPGDRLPLAVVASGVFPSFFAGKPAPPVGDEPEEEGIAPAPDRVTMERSAPTRIVVVGSGNAVRNDMAGQFTTNMVLLQNAVDWLTFGDELIAIRSRLATDRPLREISEGGKTLARSLVTFGVPVLVVLFGLLRYVRLRSKRAEAQSQGEAA